MLISPFNHLNIIRLRLLVLHRPVEWYRNVIIDLLENWFQGHPDVQILRLTLDQIGREMATRGFIVLDQRHIIGTAEFKKDRIEFPSYVGPGEQPGLAGKGLPLDIRRMAERAEPARVEMKFMAVPALRQAYLALTCSLPVSRPHLILNIG
jgi:hypothetical protein